jgi:glycerol-3-phosphate dehydrogenase
VSDAQATRIFRHYGSDWYAVARGDLLAGRPIPGTDCLEAEVRHAVRSELAATLADVVLRRLDLGSAEPPAESTLTACAAIVGDELGWDAARREREVMGVRASFPFANPRSQLPTAAL